MEIIIANDRINECLEIRYKVFVDEQNVPVELEKDEFDEQGSGCDHFLIIENGCAVGTFRCMFEDEKTVHLQRLCILKEYRGKDFGRKALEFADEYCKKKNADVITLNAQCYAIPFYEKCGYTVISDVFDDAGIEHRTMKKVVSC